MRIYGRIPNMSKYSRGVIPSRLELQVNNNKTLMADKEACVSSTSSKTKRKDRDRQNSRPSASGSDGQITSDGTDNAESERTVLSSRDRLSNSTSNPTFPCRTSDWTGGQLNALGIALKLCSELTPENILRTVFKESDLEPNNAQRFKQFISNHPSRGWKNLRKYTCISDVFQKDLDTLRLELTSVDYIPGLQWACTPMEKSDTFFTQRFQVMGEMFGRYLVYLAEIHHKGEMIMDIMYLTLFQYFLEMFGLYCNTKPAIPAKHMMIKSVNVSSEPDMLILNSQKVIAVVKVKSDFVVHEDTEQPTFKRPRLPSQVQDQNPANPTRHISRHLDNKIIGQIGGDLLVHLRSSKGKNNRILGIILQQTHVTFCSLQCKEGLNIENGIGDVSQFLEENHEMEFSKSYDYLNPETCEQLMAPLIALGIMQNRSF